MKFLYIHQYFRTPKEPGGTRSYWIADKLIQEGNNVIMLTSRINDQKKTVIEYCGDLEIIYLHNNYDQKHNKIRKVLSFLNFMLKALRITYSRRKDFDKIYATSTPLSVGLPALFANLILKKPYIFEVRDLWPQAPIELGAIKNPLVISFLRKLEKTIYEKAEKIIALSPGMKEGVIKTGITPDRVRVIPNMSKPKEFYPREKSQSVSAKYSIDLNKISIIYFGSIGISNGLDSVLRFWSQLDTEEFQFVIAGEGSEKDSLQNLCNQLKIENVMFLGNYRMEVISEIVNCCDISLISFKNLPILDTNSPNKFFDSLSAGKPVIVNSNGWTKDLVLKHNLGFVYNSEDFESFNVMIDKIKKSKNCFEELGNNSRKVSLEAFDRNKLCNELVDFVMRS